MFAYNGLVPARKAVSQNTPEELIYRLVYAPVELGELLSTADSRGRIRRVPVPHLFFGLRELEDQEVLQLLPHLTEEQWTGILDLDLWSRDSVNTTAFIQWQRHILEAEDAVARKLLRATDPELWELTFKREFQVYARVEEDEFELDPKQQSWLRTPDERFLIELPSEPDKARLTRSLLLRLYELDPDRASFLLIATAARTATEIEEMAYQNRKRRVEDLGFQDYFDAVEIYSYLPAQTALPQKKRGVLREIGDLPVQLPTREGESMLLFQAMGRISRPQDLQSLLEELFFVCNKVLSADCASAADPVHIKEVVRKAIVGTNLGLECWSAGDVQKAVDGLQRHYLQSFFQMAHSRLIDLSRGAEALKDANIDVEPGSFWDLFLEGLLQKYPRLADRDEGRIFTRLFESRDDLSLAEEYLETIKKEQQSE